MNKRIITTLIALVVIITSGADLFAQAHRTRPTQQTTQRRTTTTTTTTYSRSSRHMVETSYKGFLEVAFTGGVGDNRANELDILTTHGVAIGNGFVGFGAGVNILFPQNNTLKSEMTADGSWETYGRQYDIYDCDDNAVLIPIYVDMKYNFGNTANICPFFDIKLGVSFLVSGDNTFIGEGWMDNDCSFYFTPTLGFRIPLQGKSAMNIGVTYSLISQKYNYFNDRWGDPCYGDGISLNSFGGRISVEW